MRLILAGAVLFLLLTTAFAQSESFTIQVKADRSPAVAVALVEQLRSSGADAYWLKATVRGKGVYYRVRVGRFATPDQAREAARSLSGLVADYFVAKYDPPNGTDVAGPATSAIVNPLSATRSDTAPPAAVSSESFSAEEKPALVPASFFRSVTASPRPTDELWRGTATSPRISAIPSPTAPQIGRSTPRGTWEFFIAGGGSLWSDKEIALTARDFIGRDLGPPGSAQPAIRLREAFATGARAAIGIVKNTSEKSAFELSYVFGTNNFKLTALEDGAKIGIPDIQRGATVSLGMRSHLIGYHYRRTLWEGEISRIYLTFGGNVAVFVPHDEGSRLRLLSGDPAGFRSGPSFESVVTPVVNYGGGWIVKLNQKVALRFDVRDYLTFAKRVRATAELSTGEKVELKLFGGTVHNLVPTFGLVFIF